MIPATTTQNLAALPGTRRWENGQLVFVPGPSGLTRPESEAK